MPKTAIETARTAKALATPLVPVALSLTKRRVTSVTLDVDSAFASMELSYLTADDAHEIRVRATISQTMFTLESHANPPAFGTIQRVLVDGFDGLLTSLSKSGNIFTLADDVIAACEALLPP